jgi:hypothetical protein
MNMRIYHWLLAGCAWTSAHVAFAATPSEAVAQATQAFLSGNGAAIQSLVLSTVPWESSKDADELYAAAYVQFRRAQSSAVANDKKALKSAGERCVATATLAAGVAKSAEAFALQSACFGYLANLGGFAAISNGRKSGKAMEAALAIDARNPRVVLVDAISYTFRPRIAGGDKAKSYARAKESAALFEAARSKGASLAQWGQAEAWYWVGRGAENSGDAAAARLAYERALAIEPAFVAARRRISVR